MVIKYGFLWQHEAAAGQDYGKARPCLIRDIERRDGDLIVSVLPITTIPQKRDSRAVPIPPALGRSLGLGDKPSSIITSERNEFRWPGHDLEPISRSRPNDYAYGRVPQAVLKEVETRIQENAREARLKTQARDASPPLPTDPLARARAIRDQALSTRRSHQSQDRDRDRD